MQSLNRVYRLKVPAAPERVFPLLCPILEYKWLANWHCELLNSVSGVAEEDCVFRTAPPGAGPMTWVVSRYEPNARIEFTCFVDGIYVFRLKICLTPDGPSTRLEWTRRWISVGPGGNAWLATWSEAEQEKSMDFIGRALTHFLVKGVMLQP